MKIKGYHIHIYCKPEQVELAQSIRESMLSELKVIEGAGPVRSGPVGPHPLPMFEAWFQPEGLSQVLLWIQQHRQGLPVLIHALTGDDYLDHTRHALWIGEELKLNLDVLKSSF